jgi:hypothetical protein
MCRSVTEGHRKRRSQSTEATENGGHRNGGRRKRRLFLGTKLVLGTGHLFPGPGKAFPGPKFLFSGSFLVPGPAWVFLGPSFLGGAHSRVFPRISPPTTSASVAKHSVQDLGFVSIVKFPTKGKARRRYPKGPCVICVHTRNFI